MADVKKVLVVDDHFEMLEFLQSMLELSEYDYEVLAVPSAEEGMLELGRTTFDLLITDVRLPGMSGFDFVRRARRRSRNEALPVIMITAYSSDQGRQEADELGVYRYFTKPFADTDEVLTAVNQILYGAPPTTKTGAGITVVPRVDITLPSSVDRRLQTLTADTGAALVLLATKKGQMLVETGAVRDVDTEQLAAVISSNLINSKQLTEQLGGNSVTTIQYHAGEHLEMYTANIGTEYFMSIVFDVQVRRGRFGTMWVFTQRAIKDLLPMLPALPAIGEAKKDVEKTAVSPKKKQPVQPKAEPIKTDKPAKPKRRRVRAVHPDSASAGNIERAAKPKSKTDAPKKEEPKFTAPPPPDFSFGGDDSGNDELGLGVDDLKSLLGGTPAKTTAAPATESDSELVQMDADALKNLLGGALPPTDSAADESDSELVQMDADALKNLLGGALPPTDSAADESDSELVQMDADALKNLLGGTKTAVSVDEEESEDEAIPPADDLAHLLALDDVPDDEAISFGDTAILKSTPAPEQAQPMSYEEAQRMGLIGGTDKPADEPEPAAGLDDMLKNLENPVDLDAFWDTAISSADTVETSGMSIEEARRQGFLSNDTSE